MHEPDADTIYLYTDTSVLGDWYIPGSSSSTSSYARRMVGPATVGWCAWHNAPTAGKPTFAGHATVGGERGPQAGEYKAILHGLAATLIYIRTTPSANPTKLTLHTDNEHVYKQLTGAYAVERMRDYYDHAQRLITELRELGVETYVLQTTKKTDPAFGMAHTLSRSAWDTILAKEWRPARHAPKPTP